MRMGDRCARHVALSRDTARRIVQDVLDRTCKDVHSLLLYQDGKLVIGEYSHGCDADRPRQMRSATKSGRRPALPTAKPGNH